YMGGALPVGSVIDAFAEGIHCGSFIVRESGKYGFLVVYGDDLHTPEIDGAGQDDLIRFYVNGVEAIPLAPAFWTSNGDVYEVCLEAATPTVHACDLTEGWNLVSWNIDQGTNNITEALASIEECLVVVLGYEAGGLTYDPTLPLFSTLNYVDYLSGYWINVNCDITLEITGTAVPTTTPIPVTEGWNLVSYLPDDILATPIALASIHDDLIVALGADNVYQPGDDIHNTLLEMSSCHGYWVKVAQGGQLIYPGPIPAPAPQVRANLMAAKGVPGLIPTTGWMNLYAHELLLDGAPVPAGATITAHTGDGKLIGSFAMEQDGLFGFMPVYADDPATDVTEGARQGEAFHLQVNGVRTMEEFVWTGHAQKREISSLISKSSSDGTLPSGCSLAQNYPNPFNPTTTISFSLPSAGRARIEIYNILGRLVAVPHDGMSSAGNNQIVWNGKNSAGKPVSSGVYFYRLTADNYTETRKMTLLK
ncbi:MAG: T9SS type A sorting domain-containing protein, partial [candidate division Zixibacteria bacterium]|nr:T9SS type A sorting domain-containing protein [candidate division Zixibacteria bacterium]